MTCTELDRRIRLKATLDSISPYEPGKPIEEVKRELGLEEIVKLASNENPLGPSPRVVETLNQTALGLHLYPDLEGWHLREDLSRALGVPIPQIALGAGSAELMRLLADAFLENADEALMADVCFPVYATATRLAGAKPVVVPLDGKLDYHLEAMLEAVTPRTRMAFLASPNNPTGRVIPFWDLKGFVERLPPHILCILDLAYLEYIRDPASYDYLGLLRRHPNIVALRTFSKAYGLAGLRIGYAVASPEIVEAMARVRMPFNTNTAAQLAARIALQDQVHLERTVALNRQMLGVMAFEVGKRGLRMHQSQANFAVVETRETADAMFGALLRRGVVVRPVRTPRIPNAIRISTGTEPQMRALFYALDAVLRELEV